MTVHWTAEAYADLDAIFAHIAQDDPAAGARVVDRVETYATEQLELFPESGRQGRAASTRELVVPDFPYIVAYEIIEREVRVLGVIHGKRRWPSTF